MVAATLPSIKLTMDTYGHLFEDGDKESAERMDQIFYEGEKGKEMCPAAAVKSLEDLIRGF
jgi:hypothetical protein